MLKKIRVRFAPSPTGFMHIGNVRAALLNYLFAHQKKGTFVLRIEDTDQNRNIDESGSSIVEILKWLSLKYDEGPMIGGDFGPYFQSERTAKYQKQLDDMIRNQLVYRCFCSKEELEEKREAQIANNMPPRYDRTCLHLSDDKIKEKIAAGIPFIWRFKVNQDSVVEIDSMERGIIKFEMKNFSDFALTRQDGSFTFLFSNFVDDYLMQITHVIRGEDHLTNAAMQAALFYACSYPLPKFWHLPMLLNSDGKKMSKRDFGFGIQELKEAGFLPEAILNFVALLGNSFKDEIQSIGELTQNFEFEKVSSTGSIKFDLEKLHWVNHKWIERTPADRLVRLVKPFLHEQIEESVTLDDKKLEFILSKIKTDLRTLKDIGEVLNFYFNQPKVSIDEIKKQFGDDKTKFILKIINKHCDVCEKTEIFLQNIKADAKDYELSMKEIFGTVRYLLTGKFNGVSVHDLFEILPDKEIASRLKKIS
ncbi:glutamate--tRNA ligase [Candidatus Dependentiae bacterium]|nr:glutamate--tRNA ligase [Candidatus Dependentiae bacterium]MBU4387359.1 glutamate--tRNA ligase [Candidatus Dependentiae bacterium]MCG2756072.1 glutamate--tRNA ligase [Candidatus Dependentiae bacterium]